MAKSEFLKTCYQLTEPEAVRAFYEDKARSYDESIEDVGYVAPQVTASLFAHYVNEADAKIIDLGCGTGLAGLALAKLGFSQLIGADVALLVELHAPLFALLGGVFPQRGVRFSVSSHCESEAASHEVA